MNYHMIIRVVNVESRFDERPNSRRAFFDPLACRGSCEGILNWRRNNSEGGTSGGADFTNGCQRSGDPACTRRGRRGVHRRERWWTRRAPSQVVHAEAVRASGDFFCETNPISCRRDRSAAPYAEVMRWTQFDIASLLLKRRIDALSDRRHRLGWDRSCQAG